MTDYSVDIREFLQMSSVLPVIDVRSPGEYEHAHIPGAVNLPLFTNEERSVIGTLYLRKGSSEAMTKGLEFIGPKMALMAEAGRKMVPGGEALMHCWRGGMRSNSMAWLMNTVGIRTHTLAGGYKSYRRHVQWMFAQPIPLVVVGGMTGSGKSEVLEKLELMGQQVIHLERLACHKGSVFGGIGMPEQPSTEQFENELFRVLSLLDSQCPIYIEDESLAIGNVFLPRAFYDLMSASRFVQLVVPLERRIHTLVTAYTMGDRELLLAGVKRIERRLGLEHARNIAASIHNGRMEEAVMDILRYYDRSYARSMSQHQRKEPVRITVESETTVEIAEKIVREFSW
jgi:tRNA 2-selenouridine synthase